jgi:Tfp pilus assembly protein PilF
MKHRPAMALVLLVVFLATGCASTAMNPVTNLFRSPAEQALATGVAQFEDGSYAEASRSLQSALDQGLPKEADKVKAYKHLAFIHCVSGRRTPCQDSFRQALKINPALELEPSEAGHPTWGPVFRAAKGRR